MPGGTKDPSHAQVIIDSRITERKPLGDLLPIWQEKEVAGANWQAFGSFSGRLQIDASRHPPRRSALDR
jgi:hypothetical protein